MPPATCSGTRDHEPCRNRVYHTDTNVTRRGTYLVEKWTRDDLDLVRNVLVVDLKVINKVLSREESQKLARGYQQRSMKHDGKLFHVYTGNMSTRKTYTALHILPTGAEHALPISLDTRACKSCCTRASYSSSHGIENATLRCPCLSSIHIIPTLTLQPRRNT
jgi:hypothetical protein